MDEAKKIATELGIDTNFREKRAEKRRKQFDECGEEDVILSAEQSFKVNYLICLLDHVDTLLQSRFEQFQIYEETFGFLFNLTKLKCASDNSLKSSCMNLEEFLKHDFVSDIDGNVLFLELRVIKKCLPVEVKKVIDMLNFLKSMKGCYPTATIAYRILLTILVTVASAERSFSKLKLIKSYLRSSMSQERLNELAMLSIEKEMLANSNFEGLINDFASKNH